MEGGVVKGEMSVRLAERETPDLELQLFINLETT